MCSGSLLKVTIFVTVLGAALLYPYVDLVVERMDIRKMKLPKQPCNPPRCCHITQLGRYTFRADKDAKDNNGQGLGGSCRRVAPATILPASPGTTDTDMNAWMFSSAEDETQSGHHANAKGKDSVGGNSGGSTKEENQQQQYIGLEGLEDVVYVQVPADFSPDGNGFSAQDRKTKLEVQELQKATNLGAVSCATGVHWVLSPKNTEGPSSVPHGRCVLILHSGDVAIDVLPIHFEGFPHQTLDFHPHGLYRTTGAPTHPPQASKFLSELSRDTKSYGVDHDLEGDWTVRSAEQRIYAINHAFTRGDDRVEMFRLVFRSNATHSTVALRFESSLVHPSWGQNHRGGLNDLVVDDTFAAHLGAGDVVASDCLPVHKPLAGSAFPETWEQKFELPLALLQLLFDRPPTTFVDCPFITNVTRMGIPVKPRHERVSGDGGATEDQETIQGEEEEEEAGMTPEEVLELEKKRLSAMELISYEASACRPIGNPTAFANGVAMVLIEAPPTHAGKPPTVFRFLFQADLIKHQLAVLVGQIHPDTGKLINNKYHHVVDLPLANAIDNLEFDPTCVKGGERRPTPVGADEDEIAQNPSNTGSSSSSSKEDELTKPKKTIHKREYHLEFESVERSVMHLSGLRFHYGAIHRVADAFAFNDDTHNPAVTSPGGLAELTLSIRYDSHAQNWKEKFRVYDFMEREVVMHNGDQFPGTSAGVVLGAPPTRQVVLLKGHQATSLPDAAIAVMGSYAKPGLFLCLGQ